jgi:hypothetical protein
MPAHVSADCFAMRGASEKIEIANGRGAPARKTNRNPSAISRRGEKRAFERRVFRQPDARCVIPESGVISVRTSNLRSPMASVTTVAAILDRLARDGRGDLITAVRDRTISAHSAGILAGYFRRKPTKSSNKRRLAIESMLMRRRGND